jgi:predicted nucleic acid-binding Zn ribbon protein
MKTLKFEKSFTWLHSGISGWCDVDCPVCGKYHSENFLFNGDFEFIKGKKEYIRKCLRCGAHVIIDMGSAEQNDKFIELLNKKRKRFESEITGNMTLTDFK